jgi:hypothetical protein
VSGGGVGGGVGGGNGGGTFASWLNILTHNRHTRRSSVGFTDSIVTGIGKRTKLDTTSLEVTVALPDSGNFREITHF